MTEIRTRDEYEAFLKERAKATPAPSAGGDVGKTFAEGAGSGFIDTLTAPVRILSAGLNKVGEMVEGRPQEDPFASGTGRQFMADVVGSARGEDAAREFANNMRARAEANPTAAALGSGAGQLAGALATGGLAGAAGRGLTTALGGGVAARLAGGAAAGALSGAQMGVAGAGDTAYLHRQQLDAEHALASAGLGALLGGSLGFGGAGLGEAARAASPLVRRGAQALEGLSEEMPARVGKAVSEAAPAVAGKVVKTGLKLAGLSHGLPGYLAGEVIGEAAAPAVTRFIEQNSGAIGAMAQRGAKVASKVVQGAVDAGEAAAPTVARLAPVSTQAVFQGNHESPEDAYTARVKELQNLGADNGALIREKVADSFGPLAHQQPGAVLAATDTASRGVQYLLSTIPSQGPNTKTLTPMTSTFVPPRADMARWARVYAAVMQPKTVLADIQRGTVTTDQINAVKTVYPQWFDDNIVKQYGEKLAERDADGNRLTPQATRIANLVLGTSTGLDSVDLGVQMGNAFTPKPAPAPRRGTGAHAKPLNTPTDTVLSSNR